jgi:hypothetical protein
LINTSCRPIAWTERQAPRYVIEIGENLRLHSSPLVPEERHRVARPRKKKEWRMDREDAVDIRRMAANYARASQEINVLGLAK